MHTVMSTRRVIRAPDWAERTRGGQDMQERRRHPRKAVSWLARLWLTESWFTIAKTVNASKHGLCLAISQRIPASALKPGERYRLEVRTEPDGELVFAGTLRGVKASGMGFEIGDLVPVDSQHSSRRSGQATTPGRK
jgi:hypothetical protein